MNQYHWEILDQNRLDLWQKLGFIADAGFYLAGGTALALQLGHRTSMDFDFYHPKLFTPLKLSKNIVKAFPSATIKVPAEDTLFAEINGVEFSFFPYQYQLIRPLVMLPPLHIASVEDIAAMKCVTISQRGRIRDYFDIYYLLQRYPVGELLRMTAEKFPNFDTYNIFVALGYFDDAEKDDEPMRFRVFDKSVTWEVVKGSILKHTRQYQLSQAQS